MFLCLFKLQSPKTLSVVSCREKSTVFFAPETFDINSKYAFLENNSKRKSKRREERRSVNLHLFFSACYRKIISYTYKVSIK